VSATIEHILAGAQRRNAVMEEMLTSDNPRFTEDPRIVLLREPCPRPGCRAPRGQYCRTTGGYTTLHKARNPRGLRELDERLNRG
jgi:hypothetical protein